MSASSSGCVEDDLYDFSGLSLNDLSLLQRGLMMATSATGQQNTDADDEEEEWYPPTPPPYDVADKLVEANSRLQADPMSNVRVADKIRWRSDSSLVEVKWVDFDGGGDFENAADAENNNAGPKEIVIVSDASSLSSAVSIPAAVTVHCVDVGTSVDDDDEEEEDSSVGSSCDSGGNTSLMAPLRPPMTTNGIPGTYMTFTWYDFFLRNNTYEYSYMKSTWSLGRMRPARIRNLSGGGLGGEGKTQILPFLTSWGGACMRVRTTNTFE